MGRKREPFDSPAPLPQCSLCLPSPSPLSALTGQNFSLDAVCQHTDGLGECSGPATWGSCDVQGCPDSDTYTPQAVFCPGAERPPATLRKHMGVRLPWDRKAEVHPVAKGKPLLPGLVKVVEETRVGSHRVLMVIGRFWFNRYLSVPTVSLPYKLIQSQGGYMQREKGADSRQTVLSLDAGLATS